MKLTKKKLKEIIKEEIQKLNEATTYKGVFDYNLKDPHKAGRSFEEMFDGADYGYSESWDSFGWNDDNNWLKAVDEYHKEMFDGADYGYSESWDSFGWNDNKNWQKAIDEYHKEMFKLVDEHIKTVRKAEKFYNTKDKIFKKWRKTDGSKEGD